jgi:hypothetical protein
MIADEFHTSVPFTALSADWLPDATGTVFIAFQCQRGAQHIKYCRICKRVGETLEDVCEVEGIYGEPKLMLRVDGGATVYGFNRDRSALVRADVPGFVRKP